MLSGEYPTVAKNANNETLRLKCPPSLTEQKQLYSDGGTPAVPVGNDAGGHGVRLAADPDAPGFVCDVPEELPAELVEPEEFGKLEFVEPEFVVVGSAPGFAVAGLEPGFEVAGFAEPAVPGAFPGSVPHGDPLGVVPGLFVVFGFTVEGDVLVPARGWCRRIRSRHASRRSRVRRRSIRAALRRRLRSCLWCRRLCRRSRVRSRWCRGLGRRRGRPGWWSRRVRRTLGHRPTRTATEYE